MMVRIAASILALILLCALGEFAWRALTGQPPHQLAALAPSSGPGWTAPVTTIPPLVAPPPQQRRCGSGDGFAQAAAQNAASLQTLPVAPFKRGEIGWEVYAPLTALEIGTVCPAQAAGFAQALAAWQVAHGLPASGVMDDATLTVLKGIWLSRRPFVAATAHGACPAPPTPDRLAWAQPAEGYSAKPFQLRPAALDAYRTMEGAARREDPAIAADPRLLTVFSGYRDPVSDAASCLLRGNCGGAAKANCSAHRTGLAMDLYLGAAPGYPPDSADDPNRLYLSRSPAYHWLVANAGRFGWVNYPFEPWHWEWTGEAP